MKMVDGNSILPNGYAECEYIECTSNSNSINTGVIGKSSWTIDALRPNKTGGNEILIGRQTTGANWIAASYDKRWYLGLNYTILGNCEIRTTLSVEFDDKGITATDVNSGTSVRRETGGANTNTYININGYNNNYKYFGRIYYVKCTSGGSFEGIPAKRLSDGCFGLYDIANGVFHGDAGYTGVLK